uniref:HTH myb-type domain-containing protein n=1 Tax=Strongyloides papillosus TaxID=174720 RepID=A0A0N5BEY5_STREA
MNAEIAAVRHSFENVRTVEIFVPIIFRLNEMISRTVQPNLRTFSRLNEEVPQTNQLNVRKTSRNSEPILSNSESESDDDDRKSRIKFRDEEIILLGRWFREKNG